MAKRILVTGGTGFVGCNMVAFLKKKGYFVRCVDQVVFDRIDIRGKQFQKADEVMELDLRNPDNVDIALKDIDWVFHFASDMGGVGYFTKHNYYPYINNMTMDMNILRGCEKHGVKRLFYSASACIYPTHLQDSEKVNVLSEDMIYPARADLNYGWEKLMMLQLCKEAPFDCRVGILNTVYGEYQEMEGERMKFPTALVTKVLQSIKDDKPIEIWGNGKQVRGFLHIEDFCNKAWLVMTKPYHGPVNISSDTFLSVKEFADLVCDLLNVNKNYKFNHAKPSGVITRVISNKKFEAEYKYKEKISLTEGFTRLVKYIYENT